MSLLRIDSHDIALSRRLFNESCLLLAKVMLLLPLEILRVVSCVLRRAATYSQSLVDFVLVALLILRVARGTRLLMTLVFQVNNVVVGIYVLVVD